MRFVAVAVWSVLGSLLMLLAAELGYRVIAGDDAEARFIALPDAEFDWRGPAPYMVFHATPGSELEIENELWVRLHAQTGRDPGPARVVIDAHGFRYDGDLSEPKRPGELRIFLLGGSVSLLGMRQETTICGVLERKLRAALADGTVVRCANAGIMSGISDQELAVLVHQVASLDPDVAIVYDGYNDRVARLIFEPRIGDPVGWLTREAAQRRGFDQARQVREAVESLPAWKLLLAKSRLATRFRPALRLENQAGMLISDGLAQVGSPVESSPRPDTRAIAKHLVENWRKMHGVARGLGFDLVTILQPARLEERDGEHLAEYYEILNVEISEHRERGEPWFSFDRLFDDDPDIFYDPVHTFDDGHERIAEGMLEILMEIGALPTRLGG